MVLRNLYFDFSGNLAPFNVLRRNVEISLRKIVNILESRARRSNNRDFFDTYRAQADARPVVGADHVALDAEVAVLLANTETDHLEVQVLHGVRKVAVWGGGGITPCGRNGVLA